MVAIILCISFITPWGGWRKVAMYHLPQWGDVGTRMARHV